MRGSLNHSIAPRLAVAFTGLLALVGAAQADAELPLEDFLERVRQPFIRTVSGAARGVIQHRGDQGTRRMAIDLSFQFSAKLARATATLQSGATCEMLWQHGRAGSARIVKPVPESELSLHDLGIEPDDLTFSFLFWPAVEERRRDSVSGQPCRVILLRHPTEDVEVLGWFSDKFLFPLRLEWYRTGDPEPRRVCEFTRFKQMDDGTWFIRSMRIYGRGWKTKLTLNEADLETGA